MGQGGGGRTVQPGAEQRIDQDRRRLGIGERRDRAGPPRPRGARRGGRGGGAYGHPNIQPDPGEIPRRDIPAAPIIARAPSSEARRVRKECFSKSTSRWSPAHYKQQTK